MSNHQHNVESQNYIETIMVKYTTEPAKIYLNNDMETIRNHSIIKNIGQT